MKLKKILCMLLMVFSFFLLVSCEKKEDNKDITNPNTYTITFNVDDNNVISKTYEEGTSITDALILSDVFNGTKPTKDGYTTDLTWYTSKDYVTKVTIPFELKSATVLFLKWTANNTGGNQNNGNDQNSNTGTEQPGPVELTKTTLFMVGDSTVCSFSDNYYYPRYGYGTQIGNYLDSKVTIKNLAHSGDSSRSYLTVSKGRYELLTDGQKGDNLTIPGISEGDYLLIGFGHNDQKAGDTFTDATKPTTDETSFKYYLYNYYVKLALDRGAYPILCTPIVRASSSNDYSGERGHKIKTGDYAQAIRELGEEFNVPVIDLTAITEARYTELGYSEAKWYHAYTQGKYNDYGEVVPNEATVDNTHLNIYGAKYVAYKFAEALKNTDSKLKNYVLADIKAPTKEADLVHNEKYELTSYFVPVMSAYTAPDHFKTTTPGWYGSAFGYTSKDPSDAANGFVATETSTGVFKVGQTGTTKYGAINATNGDGFAFVFQQLDKSKGFVFTADAKILSTKDGKNSAFGLMVRDDCYLRQKESFKLESNFVATGLITSTSKAYGIFDRTKVNTTSKLTWNSSGFKVGDSVFKANDTVQLKLEKENQTIKATVTYNDVTKTQSYPDFDLFITDTNYYYVGMFATAGTVVEFTNVSFTLNEAQGA